MNTTQGSHIECDDSHTQVRQEAARQKQRAQALRKQTSLLNTAVAEPSSLALTSHFARTTREHSVLLQGKNQRIRRDCQSVRASLQVALKASRLALDAARIQLDASRIFNASAARPHNLVPEL
ncbi:MAG: hypothetical protein EOO39_28740 [Cytophagaceae bacterium]|nr:MAG: hypothetical protein EOO39_28740 [Cytophagaceae bacterium]